MAKQAKKILEKWILETREMFREFLDETDFPDPERLDEHGPKLMYPEWIIMFIAVLSVIIKVKSYVQIHKMAKQYRDIIAKDLSLKPISERQLRDRLRKNLPSPLKTSNVYLSALS